jgi:hypothetical protein
MAGWGIAGRKRKKLPARGRRSFGEDPVGFSPT